MKVAENERNVAIRIEFSDIFRYFNSKLMTRSNQSTSTLKAKSSWSQGKEPITINAMKIIVIIKFIEETEGRHHVVKLSVVSVVPSTFGNLPFSSGYAVEC